MSLENLRKVYGDDATSWPTNHTVPQGPSSFQEDADAEEYAALVDSDRRAERENAEEMGVSVGEYRNLLADQDAKVKAEEDAVKSGWYAANARREQEELRRKVGLPSHVLPGANFLIINGIIVIHYLGLSIHGRFSVDENGVPFGPDVRKLPAIEHAKWL